MNSSCAGDGGCVWEMCGGVEAPPPVYEPQYTFPHMCVGNGGGERDGGSAPPSSIRSESESPPSQARLLIVSIILITRDYW
jgi:hypothetical protein